MSEVNDSHFSSEESEGYEKRDINLKKIISITIAMFILLVVILVALTQYFVTFKEQQVYKSVLQPESKELRELRAREDEILNSYKVIDKEKGIYQIPIIRAMELVAEESYKKSVSGKENQ